MGRGHHRGEEPLDGQDLSPAEYDEQKIEQGGQQNQADKVRRIHSNGYALDERSNIQGQTDRSIHHPDHGSPPCSGQTDSADEYRKSELKSVPDRPMEIRGKGSLGFKAVKGHGACEKPETKSCHQAGRQVSGSGHEKSVTEASTL